MKLCVPFRSWKRYKSVVQFLLVVAAIVGYCLVLGNYAVANFQQVALLANRSSVLPKKQMTTVTSSSTRVSTQSPVVMARLEAEMEARRQLVADTCQKYDLNSHGQPNAWEFFIDRKHRIVWCNVFKAASSTWMYYFNLLGGYKDQYLRLSRKAPLVLARTQFPRPTVQQLGKALPDSLSFMIVREPFERLLSAYRNKIESYRHRFYRKMAHEMIVKYRKPGVTRSKLNAALGSPDFSDFVNYVVDSGRGYDEHWAPYHTFCTPCHVNFTVIANLETYERDQDYIISKAQIGDVLTSAVQRRNPKKVMNRGRGGKTTNDLVEKYYSQLTLKQVQGLYRIYGVDFEMFGYNATKYFHMAKAT